LKRFLLILVLAAAAFGLVLWLARSGRQPAVALPDRSVLRLREVSYGREHRHVSGTISQRLYAMIPEVLRGKVSNIAVLTNAEPFVVFWLTRDHVADQRDNLWFGLEDANGYVAGLESHTWQGPMPFPRQDFAVRFDNWPRREGSLKLAIYRMTTNEVVKRIGTATIKNPAPRTYASWPAVEPPVSARAGNYDFTLNRLIVGVNAEGKPQPLRTRWESRVLTEFRASRDGRPSQSWAPAGMTISDATGNSTGLGSWGISSGDGENRMTFRSSLWPGEPWKLRVEFSRTANYARNDLVRFPPIALPKELVEGRTTDTFTVNVSTNWHDVALTVVALEGKGRSFSGPGVRVRCGKLPADHRLTMVSMEDNQKRNLWNGGSGSDSTDYGYSLKFASNSTVLHLTLAIHKSLFAEFIAKPTLVTTNGAAH
jgi:hypothetical protein